MVPANSQSRDYETHRIWIRTDQQRQRGRTVQETFQDGWRFRGSQEEPVPVHTWTDSRTHSYILLCSKGSTLCQTSSSPEQKPPPMASCYLLPESRLKTEPNNHLTADCWNSELLFLQRWISVSLIIVSSSSSECLITPTSFKVFHRTFMICDGAAENNEEKGTA